VQAPASFGFVGAILGIALLALVLAITITVPLLAVPFFLFGLIVFLLWQRRHHVKQAPLPEREGVPSTEEAAGDPVADSGAGVVARRDSRH
jgi:hypothetical protein